MMSGAAPGTSQLWVVRHGETEWSASGRHTGRRDIDLTRAGEDAARALAPRLSGMRFAAVLASPRVRARRTAELAGFSTYEVVDDLVEWDYGDDEGRTTAEIRRDRPGWTVWSHGPRGGETAEEVARRADRVIDRVRATAGATLGFSHGHMSRVIAARWLGLPAPAGVHLKFSTSAVGVLGWERDAPAVEVWNDTGTLPHPVGDDH